MSEFTSRRLERLRHDLDVLHYLYTAVGEINNDGVFQDLANHIARRIRQAREEIALIESTDEAMSL